MMTFDFGDGNGPVPARRHVNPDGSEGGWIASTATVDPTCTVGPNTLVYGKAQVSGNALIYGEAHIYGEARVYGDAQVYDGAVVAGEAQVYGEARVCGSAWVSGNTTVEGDAILEGGVFEGGGSLKMPTCGSGTSRTSRMVPTHRVHRIEDEPKEDNMYRPRRPAPSPEETDLRNLRIYRLHEYCSIVDYIHEDPEILEAWLQVKDMTEAMVVTVLKGEARTYVDDDEDGWSVSFRGEIEEIELPEDVDTDKVEQFEEATGYCFKDFLVEVINAALDDDPRLCDDLFYDLFA